MTFRTFMMFRTDGTDRIVEVSPTVNMKTRIYTISLRVILLQLAAACWMYAGPTLAQTGVAPDESGGERACLLCHNTAPTNLILQTPHAVRADPRTPFASAGCQGCHGGSIEHMQGAPVDGRRAPPDVVFGKDSPDTSIAEDQNSICIGCHTSGNTLDWHGSQHQFADLVCASCHSVHALKDNTLDKLTQAETCYTCHEETRAQSFRPHRHPLREGIMSCADCHNPHGAHGPAMLSENTTNDTCYQCHQDKRGPFLWEHQPVREDCMLCHAPHGSTQPRMLIARMPYLCNMCHSENFHPSTVRSGTGLPPLGADSNLLAGSCLNCHSQVHGSNHPSGTGLTR